MMITMISQFVLMIMVHLAILQSNHAIAEAFASMMILMIEDDYDDYDDRG